MKTSNYFWPTNSRRSNPHTDSVLISLLSGPFPMSWTSLFTNRRVSLSTAIKYIASIRHKPMDRLDIVIGIRPPQRDLPFAELDVLYTHILANVEDVERVLEILSVLLFFREHPWNWTLSWIEEILSLQHGDAELYLGNLSSIIELNQDTIRVLHASLTDFLVDPTRSKEFWINPRARHTMFARRCLQSLQLKGKDDYLFRNISILIYQKEDVTPMWWALFCVIYHLENTEMTLELHDNLIYFPFDNLQNVIKKLNSHSDHGPSYHICYFAPRFLGCLKKLVCHHFCSFVLQILMHARFSDLAIFWSRSYHFDLSSWLWQDALRYSGKILLLPRIFSASGKHPAVQRCRKPRFSPSWDNSFFIFGSSAREGVDPWCNLFSPRTHVH